jgi:hypothetical protein
MISSSIPFQEQHLSQLRAECVLLHIYFLQFQSSYMFYRCSFNHIFLSLKTHQSYVLLQPSPCFCRYEAFSSQLSQQSSSSSTAYNGCFGANSYNPDQLKSYWSVSSISLLYIWFYLNVSLSFLPLTIIETIAPKSCSDARAGTAPR